MNRAEPFVICEYWKGNRGKETTLIHHKRIMTKPQCLSTVLFSGVNSRSLVASVQLLVAAVNKGIKPVCAVQYYLKSSTNSVFTVYLCIYQKPMWPQRCGQRLWSSPADKIRATPLYVKNNEQILGRCCEHARGNLPSMSYQEGTRAVWSPHKFTRAHKAIYTVYVYTRVYIG